MKIRMYVPRPAVLLETCAVTAPISITRWYTNNLAFFFLNYDFLVTKLLLKLLSSFYGENAVLTWRKFDFHFC